MSIDSVEIIEIPHEVEVVEFTNTELVTIETGLIEAIEIPITEIIFTEGCTEVIDLGGTQGPPGPPGTGGVIEYRVIAGEDLGGLRGIRSVGNRAYYADSSIPDHAITLLGISAGAAVIDDIVDVISSGNMIDPSWNWNDGAIYLGANGLLTQVAPANGFIAQVAIAISDTEMFVNIQQPILRN